MSEIYHFTCIDSMKSIIESKELWATHYSMLNDVDETHYYLGLINNEIDKREYKNEYKNLMKKFIQKTLEHYGCDYYVISFTENEDSIGLWSTYSKGEGCCLELNTKNLLKCLKSKYGLEIKDYIKGEKYNIAPSDHIIIENNESNFNESEKRTIFAEIICGKMQYDEKSIIDDINKSITSWDNLIKECTTEDNFFLPDFYIEEVLERRIFIKRRGFSAEQEYRIILKILDNYWGRNYVHFRVKDGMIIPYVRVNIHNISDIIKKIIIHPKVNYENARSGLSMFLISNNLDKVLVEKSEMKIRY